MCPACGGRLKPWRQASVTDPQLAGRDAYPLARCERCGSAVTMDAGSSPTVGLYEAGTYADARGSLDWLLEPLRRLSEIDRTRFLARVPGRARILEVGAGDGRFLARLNADGYRVSGIEPAAGGGAAARSRGVAVQNVGIEEARIDSGSQDAVVLWHVLEHLDDPGEALDRARRWLAPGGRAIVACPDLGSLQARIGGDGWFHQDVPRHRTHFTSTGLRALLGRTGYRVDRVSHLVIEQNPLGMWQTLLNRLTRERDVAFRFLKRDLGDVVPRDRRRDLAVTALAGPLLVPVALALELGAGLARRGGTMVVEAVPAGGDRLPAGG
ncbi:MAG: class I SAM-dependent methyltransferase [Solirubrobacterales bacterium]